MYILFIYCTVPSIYSTQYNKSYLNLNLNPDTLAYIINILYSTVDSSRIFPYRTLCRRRERAPRDDMSTMPAELKPLKRFFKRAEELDRAAAKGDQKGASVAYFCRSYALQRGLKIHRDLGELAPPTIMAFLLATMDGVEAAKASLPKYDGDAAKAFCQQFALSVFKRADDEDRNGLADKGTARTFYAAATFLDMLLQFGDLDADIKDLPLYAKYKANDIIKALKEGRQPTAGPPGGNPDDAGAGGFGGGGGGAGGGAGPSPAADPTNSAGLNVPMPAPSKPTLAPTPAPKPDPAPAPAPASGLTPVSAPPPAPASAAAASNNTPAATPAASESRRRSSSSSSSSSTTAAAAVAEDTGSNIALDIAIEMVKTAINADHAQDYVKAFSLYKECLGYFMDAVKISQNKNTKATIMSRMDAYMKRAEQLKPMVKQIEARRKK